MPTLLIFLFLCVLAVVLVAVAVGVIFYERQRKQQVTGLLHTVEGQSQTRTETNILNEPDDRYRFIRRLASGVNLLKHVETTLQQSGLDWTIFQLGIATAVVAAAALLLALKLAAVGFNILLYPLPSELALVLAAGSLPYQYVRLKRRTRLAQFEEQFPEALDFLARSMRAGHAFTISLEMMGEESPDPLGQEFRTLFNEQNLGAPLEVAFGNLMRRLPLLDVRFFVSSIMLQKQTGGNLSEILVRLSYIIRERFRLRGQVKAASAHGRLTAGILTGMPIVLMLALLFVAPGYLQGMAKDPDGKYMILAAILAQVVGYYFIRRIIKIKV